MMRKAKAFYIDSENICNFKKFEPYDLFRDIVDGDVVYVFYSNEHQREKVEKSLNLHKDVRIIYLKCRVDRECLDEKIKKVIHERYARYVRHIIISSDTDFTGYIRWNALKKVERRGVQGASWYKM